MGVRRGRLRDGGAHLLGRPAAGRRGRTARAARRRSWRAGCSTSRAPGKLQVYAPTSGKLLASLPFGDIHWQSPIVADGRVALAEGNSNSHATPACSTSTGSRSRPMRLEPATLPRCQPHRPRRRRWGATALVVLAVAAVPAAARGHGQALHLVHVAKVTAPVYATAPPGETGKLYVVEQAGQIVVLTNGKVSPTPFLDIHSLVTSGGEQGLLSMAFDPGYAKNHRFYVDYTDQNGDTRVVRYISNGTTAIPVVGQAAPLRQGLRLEPQRRPAAVRPRRAALLGQRRRRRGGRPERQRPEPEPAVREDHAPQRERREPALAARRLRPPQPVALLVRPQDRRPLHRRRRPGQVGGDRLPAARLLRASPTSAGSTTRGTTSTTTAPRC